MFGRKEVDDKGSLQDQIHDIEMLLERDKSRAAANLRVVGRRTRRRMTQPTTLVFAGSIGFVTAELLRARKSRKKSRRAGGQQKNNASLLAPLAGLAQAAWSLGGSFMPGGRSRLPVEDPSHLSMNV